MEARTAFRSPSWSSCSQAGSAKSDDDEPSAKRSRSVIPLETSIGALDQLKEQLQEADTARAEAVKARSDLAERTAELAKAQHVISQKSGELLARTMHLDAATEREIGALRHYSRYARNEMTPLDKDGALFEKLRTHFKASMTSHRGRVGGPKRAKPFVNVTRIDCISAPSLQANYFEALHSIGGQCDQKATTLTGVKAQRVQSIEGIDVNEFLMYHGAEANLVSQLHKSGVDPREFGTQFGQLFKSGMYLSTNSSLSDMYTTPNEEGERCVLLMRVCLGEPQLTAESVTNLKKPAERKDGRGSYHSVVPKTRAEGGQSEHPEYIVYDAWQVLPAYAIWYKHFEGMGCFCTHCVTQPINVTLVCEDLIEVHKKPVLITGLTTAGDLKKMAAAAFDVPITDMGRVANVFGEPSQSTPFTDDNETCASRSVRSGECIEITLTVSLDL